MRIKVLPVALLGLVIAAPASLAAAPTWLGANVGLSVPTGDFRDEASLGFFGGLTGTYMLNDVFGLGGDINIHSPGVADDFEEAMAAAAGSSVDVNLRAIQITPHVRVVLPSRGTVKPFVKGGLGLYNFGSKIEGGSLDVDDSESKFGWNLGIGAQAMATEGILLTGELAYHSVNAEGRSADMITLGVGVLFGIGSR